jgi:Zn-finger nucleic acid-binding protein
MQCISCQLEINPQWAHAIDINVCPFCGKHIMDGALKTLFGTLRETMEQLQPYQTQLDDWMLSNHNYIKTDSPNLVDYLPADILKDLKKAKDDQDFLDRKKFTVKVKTENGVEEVQAQSLQSEDKTSAFFKRAEVIRTPSSGAPSSPNSSKVFSSPTEKTQHLKEMANQIKKAGSAGLTMAGGSITIPAEMLEQADPEAVAEFQSMISGGEVASSLPDSGDDDMIPAHILAANQQIAAAKSGHGGSGGVANAADLLKLQQMQDRVQKSKSDFESGANRGKGGFSRSG